MKRRIFYVTALLATVLCWGSCSEKGLNDKRMKQFRTEVLPYDTYIFVQDNFNKFDNEVYNAQLTEVYQKLSNKISESDRMAKMLFGNDLFKGLEGNQKSVNKLYNQASEYFTTLGTEIVEQVKSNPDSVKNILNALINSYSGGSLPDSLNAVCSSRPYSDLVLDGKPSQQAADIIKGISKNVWKADLHKTFEMALSDENSWIIDNQRLAQKDAANRSSSRIIANYVLLVTIKNAIDEAQKNQKILYIHQNEENDNVYEVGLSNKKAYRLAFDKDDNLIYKPFTFNELFIGENVEK